MTSHALTPRQRTRSDAELQLFRSSVNCAAVLEGMVGGWKLDVRESTRRSLKYRRAKGEILIITHGGRGWWDPLSQAKGDIFDLVQYLDGGLNFGQVRQVLRRFVGVAPTYPTAIRAKQGRGHNRPPQERWAKRPCLRPGSPAWAYLAGVRCLPTEILTDATAQDVVREGYYGSAWFAHRTDGAVSHVEVRGPDYKGSLAGGHKTLFVFGQANEDVRRVAITEGPIDALSLAALDGSRPDTLYVATGGGMGPGTLGRPAGDADPARHHTGCPHRERYGRERGRRPLRGTACRTGCRCGRTLRAGAPAGRPRFQRRSETGKRHMKRDRTWVRLPSAPCD